VSELAGASTTFSVHHRKTTIEMKCIYSSHEFHHIPCKRSLRADPASVRVSSGAQEPGTLLFTHAMVVCIRGCDVYLVALVLPLANLLRVPLPGWDISPATLMKQSWEGGMRGSNVTCAHVQIPRCQLFIVNAWKNLFELRSWLI
jgi:hypothetical protein